MRLTKKLSAQSNDLTAIEMLAQATPLSKAKLKDAMTKGAVLLRRRKTIKRLRKAQFPLVKGDELHLHYDEALLNLQPPVLEPIADLQGYSVWNKPAGVMSQGNDFGDHMSLLRIAERYFDSKRPVFLIHRLDRETSGLVLIAHNKAVASALSRLIQERKVIKHYQALVFGQAPEKTTIDRALDGKASVTHISVLRYDQATNTSLINVQLETGRKHQIRRHLNHIGHPIMGDPRYGQGNKNSAGLMLAANRLSFQCPVSGTLVTYEIDAPFSQA